jgi:hypothetical protein
MTIEQVCSILNGRFLVRNHDPGMDIPLGGAADLMSDVLAFGAEGMVLMTGLTNPQVVRTAEMAGINVIVFVRNKKPPLETIELARDSDITLISTAYTMFESCGLLFQGGLPGRGPVEMRGDTW